MKNTISLLPSITEEVFGISPYDIQTKGWEITKLDVDKQWVKSMGDGVTVAVIDTGCDYNHPDIKDNIIGGYNSIKKNDNFMDDNGHGSHVCGTICSPDNGMGMVGVAPKAKILAIKALSSSGAGSPNHIVNGIKYAIESKVDIITMSLGSEGDIPNIKSALQEASAANILVFCAAGNSGPSKNIMYPARDPNAISIGAIDENFDRTNFTCSGDSLDFLSPGHNILSILPGNRYGLMSGTSMSNPFAVGCAALYLSYHRQQYGIKYLSQKDMIEILQKNAIDLVNPAFRSKKYQGYGIIRPIL
jgi:major intracellular serine protease